MGWGVSPGVKALPAARPEGRAPARVPKATWFDIDQKPAVYGPPRGFVRPASAPWAKAATRLARASASALPDPKSPTRLRTIAWSAGWSTKPVAVAWASSSKSTRPSSKTRVLMAISESVTSARPMRATPDELCRAPPWVTSRPASTQPSMSDDNRGVGRS